MTERPDLKQIVAPSDEFQRTEHLRRLYDALTEGSGFAVDEPTRSFLRDYVTKDFKQAALVGLILLALSEGDASSAYARMFCALTLEHEPDLKQAVKQAMPARNPGDLYDELADITVYGDPTSVDYHYAYLVLSYVNADSLRDRFEDF